MAGAGCAIVYLLVIGACWTAQGRTLSAVVNSAEELKAAAVHALGGMKSVEDIQFDGVPMTLPGHKPQVVEIPTFLTTVLERFLHNSVRHRVHRVKSSVMKQKTNPELLGAHAIVSVQLIVPERNRKTRMSHASTIVEVEDGELLAAWYGGVAEGHRSVGIWMSRFKDGKWSDDPWPAAHPVHGHPCWNPVLVHYKDPPETQLFYKVGRDYNTWAPRFQTSSDGGRAWSQAMALPSGMSGPAKTKPVFLDDGSVIAATTELTDQGWQVSFETTEDRGRSFTRSTSHFNRLTQPTIFKSASGLGMIAHSMDEALYVAKASEDPYHWEGVSKSNVDNAHSAIDSVVLSDGRLLLVYNPVTEGRGRSKLAIAVSTDMGTTFENKVVLEDTANIPDPPIECRELISDGLHKAHSPEYSYPAIIQARDGLVHVTYTFSYTSTVHRCSGRENIKHVILDPSLL